LSNFKIINVINEKLQNTLEMCMTKLETEKRCLPLNQMCPEYVYVAVYLPDWPKNEEYFLACSALLYAPVPLGLSATLLIVIIIIVCCHLRRQRSTTATASTSTDGTSILRVNPARTVRGRYKRTWHQRARGGYGALNEYILFFLILIPY
jgi:hypothetical protein